MIPFVPAQLPQDSLIGWLFDMSFDPYHQWLGIPPSEQPPNHYRLLGIAPFETSYDVISQAAEQRTRQIRSVPTGQPADVAQRLLNEIAGARLCLLDPNIKRAYDADLGRRSPPPLPSQIAKPSAKSRTASRRRTSSLVAQILAGLGLVLAWGAGALALWWLSTDSQDRADPRAAASSQSELPSPSPSRRAEEPAERPVAEATPAKTPPPTIAVTPPIVTPPTVTDVPAQEDSSTTPRMQKNKGKKQAGKKPPRSAPRGRNKPTGAPAIASTWVSADGQSISLVQQRDQFTATGVGTDSEHLGVIWRWSGTVDKDGHLSGRLVSTQVSSNSVDRGVAATLSPDGNTIERTGLNVGMPDFPWIKGKTLPKLK